MILCNVCLDVRRIPMDLSVACIVAQYMGNAISCNEEKILYKLVVMRKILYFQLKNFGNIRNIIRSSSSLVMAGK